MFNTFQSTFAVTVAFALALLAPVMAGAESPTDRDTKEIAGYVLTDAALDMWTARVRSRTEQGGLQP